MSISPLIESVFINGERLSIYNGGGGGKGAPAWLPEILFLRHEV